MLELHVHTIMVSVGWYLDRCWAVVVLGADGAPAWLGLATEEAWTDCTALLYLR